ncbi:MAG: hypothetical protein HC794_09125 [Nitrospiraceae bacterium]|nr:hypothetical protein [Nitrospiraceae bacterium]
MARIALMGLAASAVMLLMGQIHFLIGIGGGLMVYAALVGWGGLTESDRRLVAQILSLMPGQAWLRARWAAR